MTFEEMLDQAVAMLQRRGRVAYSVLKRQFDLDNDYLEDLKDAILYAHPQVTDDGRGLAWTGKAEAPPELTSTTTPPTQPEVTQEAQPTQIESPLPEPPTPDAERRQLTVMFCDLADSTRLSGQLDPEDLRDVIRAYQSTSAEVIEHYDGYIAQHLGDGLMVYFGWPQAHEDDAQRAVHAGLGILEAMSDRNARLEQEKGIRLAVRIGIHTGLVVVGEIGKGLSQEYLALGKTPNIASRIEGIAEPDTVAISDATYQLVQGYFVCEDLAQYTLKGVDDAQQVYRVFRESNVQSRFGVAATRGLTPLVGRESETTLLRERWEQVKEGQGQVVLLSGEAGIGKSRLLQVLRDRVADEPHTRLECRSSPYYQNTALYPITDMFQRVLNWHQDDTPQGKLYKLEQTLRAYRRLTLDETMPLFADLLSLSLPEDRYPPLRLPPQQQRQKTLETIVTMLVQQAEKQPVLFILEDLHWTDPSTLELLNLLIDQIPTAALCVLLTCRPTFQPSWSSRSYLTPIALNRLSRSQIESMAERVAGGKRLPAEVLLQIVEKADGVPLFVEEMTKAVLESGLLKETDKQYELTGSFSSLAIPATLQDSLMARLDRLVTAKAVAQYASVIGRQFSYALLQTVSQLDEPTLQKELGRLVEAELIYQRGMPPQATYLFKHALVVDAAYQSLLKSTRQQYHQRIAQTLETRFPETAETQPELLAHHYTEAGLSETGIAYWQQAGERASERSAPVEAVRHFTKGLDLLATLPDRPERTQRELAMQMLLGPALMVTKGYAAPEVQQAYARARALCGQVADSPELFPVLMGLCRFYYAGGVMQPARELGEQLLAQAQHNNDAAWLVVAHTALGTILYLMGEFAQAHIHLEQGLASSLPPPEQLVLARRWGTIPSVQCLAWDALTLLFLGYPDQALRKSCEALTISQELPHPHSVVYTLSQLARLHVYRRETQAAQELVETLIPLATEQGYALWAAAGTFIQAFTRASQGQHEDGAAQMSQSMSAVLATGTDVFRPNLAWLAEIYGEMGQADEGLHLLVEVISAVDKRRQHYYDSELYRLKGALLLTQSSDNAAEAESSYHKALDIARRQQAKFLELRAATSLARLWQSQGKRQAAYELLSPVYSWFTEGFDTADLKDAQSLLAELA